MADTIIGILLALAVALLLFIAFELRTIARELGRRRFSSNEEGKGADAKGSGPTINVNLGPGAAPVVSSPDARIKLQGNLSPKAEGAPGAAPSGPAEESSSPQSAARKPAPLSVVCPRCKQENSSYRIECFNCGAAL